MGAQDHKPTINTKEKIRKGKLSVYMPKYEANREEYGKLLLEIFAVLNTGNAFLPTMLNPKFMYVGDNGYHYTGKKLLLLL